MKKFKLLFIFFMVLIIIVAYLNFALSKKVAARILVIDMMDDDFLIEIYSNGTFIVDRSRHSVSIRAEIPEKLGGRRSRHRPQVFKRISILNLVEKIKGKEADIIGEEGTVLGGKLAKADISGKYYSEWNDSNNVLWELVYTLQCQVSSKTRSNSHLNQGNQANQGDGSGGWRLHKWLY